MAPVEAPNQGDQFLVPGPAGGDQEGVGLRIWNHHELGALAAAGAAPLALYVLALALLHPTCVLQELVEGFGQLFGFDILQGVDVVGSSAFHNVHVELGYQFFDLGHFLGHGHDHQTVGARVHEDLCFATCAGDPGGCALLSAGSTGGALACF